MAYVKYEVMFLDGLGTWRRWALVSTWDRAHESRVRLREKIGPNGRIKIAVREA